MKREHSSKFWLSLSIIVLMLTIAYLGLIYFSYDLQRFSMLFNADSLYLPTLLDNLLYGHGAWKDWTLPPAPYFFPDLPLYFIAYVITKDVYLAHFIFALLQGLLVLFFLYGINRLFFSRTQALLHSVLVLALMYLSVLGHPTIHAIVSGHHFGAFLAILMGLYVFARWLDVDGRSHSLSIILIILIGLTVASDKLFIVQFVLPLILTITILRLLTVTTNRVFLLTFVVATSGLILGYLLHALWVPNPTGFSPEFGFQYLAANFPIIAKLFYKVISKHIVYGLIFMTFYGLLVYSLTRFLFSRFDQNKSFLFISLLLFLICAVNVLVVAFSNLTINFRYFIPVLFIPLLLLPLLLIMMKPKHQILMYFPHTALVITFLLMGSHFYEKLSNHQLHSSYYPKAIQCFDDFINSTKARHGVAQYWDAKRTALLSKNNVSIAAYTTDIYAYNWISTTQWQKSRYDFVLIRNQKYKQYQLDLELLKQLSPKQISHEFKCGLFSIHYFPQGLYTEPGL